MTRCPLATILVLCETVLYSHVPRPNLGGMNTTMFMRPRIMRDGLERCSTNFLKWKTKNNATSVLLGFELGHRRCFLPSGVDEWRWHGLTTMGGSWRPAPAVPREWCAPWAIRKRPRRTHCWVHHLAISLNVLAYSVSKWSRYRAWGTIDEEACTDQYILPLRPCLPKILYHR